MNTVFLIPFLCLCVCFAWSASAKASCDMSYDFVEFYNTPLFSFLQFALVICILIGVVIAGVNSGFLMGLAFLGIAIGTVLITMFILAHLLLAIFSNQGIGAILHIVCGIVSAIWMFAQSGSF